MIPLYGPELQEGEGLNCFYGTQQVRTVGNCLGGAAAPDVDIIHKYQVMAHAYDFDTHVDGIGPILTPAPKTPPSPTAITSIDWSLWDQMNGPSLTPGNLFSDGTNMRVIDAPFSAGGGPYTDGFYPGYNNYSYDNQLPPTGSDKPVARRSQSRRQAVTRDL